MLQKIEKVCFLQLWLKMAEVELKQVLFNKK